MRLLAGRVVSVALAGPAAGVLAVRNSAEMAVSAAPVVKAATPS